MIVLDPATAQPRPDLTWLRHRGRPVATPQAAPAAPEQSPPVPVPPVIVTADETSLDLGAAKAAPVEEPEAPPLRVVPTRRVEKGRPAVLSATEPVVTLNRLQSGIGRLTLEAACSNAVGDLRLAVAFRLSNGWSSVAANRDGLAVAPVGSPTPVLRVHRDRFDTITLDCRRIRELDRLLVVGYSPSGAELAWGGTLVLETLGQARVEVPMDAPPSRGASGLLTGYQVDGELVIRAEPREPTATLREACLAFGFDRITWMDASTPAT